MSTVPLTFEEKQRRSDLIRRLNKKEDSINPTEAQELRNLLEREKLEISQDRNCLAFIAITFLIGSVDAYLEAHQ